MKDNFCRKAVNFDLDTNKLKNHFANISNAYDKIKEFFEENEFEHRQGSGYVSKNKLNEDDIYDMTDKITKELSWLSDCVKKFDVTDIGEAYDLKQRLKQTTKLNVGKPKSIKKTLTKAKAKKKTNKKTHGKDKGIGI